uniref:ubiquitinyl hydrolase 1 n=1 Tax=Cyprinus carpio TaxID=7962 RepID=A0A8C1G592_CYPCA
HIIIFISTTFFKCPYLEEGLQFSDNKIYFIITAKPPSPNGYIKAGEICFIDKQRFNAMQKNNDTDVLPVVRMGKVTDTLLDKVLLQPLSRRSAELLMAVESNEDRLLALNDPEALEKASNLSAGCQVHVEYKGQWLTGVIRYIGSLKSYSSDPPTGVFFGVELQGEDKGKGQNDGSFHYKTYFICPKNSGIFAPFTRIKPEDSSAGLNDGTYKGKRYFNCPPYCGLFVKLSSCRPDDRFSGVKKKLFNGNSVELVQHSLCASFFFSVTDNDEAMVSEEQDNVPPIRTEDVSNRLIGKMKGIQGHCNSCYMDSALFSVFSCSSVLDSLLFKTTEYETIQSILLKNIVNPLRNSQSGSIQKVQSCYYYQIFMDYNHHLVLPTVQQLLEHSFYSNSLKLAEVPSCLILTMPRSGKSFKMFPKIIPSTELDITGLLADGNLSLNLYKYECLGLANQECAECFRDAAFSDTGFKYFCVKCSAQVHSHQQRRCHKPSTLILPQGFSYSQSSGSDRRTPPREKLELFAVLCIETSHYVSFVKYGPQDTDWIFFDSMADRVGNDGYNIPEVRACPEVGQYLHMPLAQLANQVPREMEGVAKRLFCDGYMYLYQSKTMSLYR